MVKVFEVPVSVLPVLVAVIVNVPVFENVSGTVSTPFTNGADVPPPEVIAPVETMSTVPVNEVRGAPSESSAVIVTEVGVLVVVFEIEERKKEERDEGGMAQVLTMESVVVSIIDIS